jgi:hypothetical protein
MLGGMNARPLVRAILPALILSAACAVQGPAQEPVTDVFVVPLDENGSLSGEPRNITRRLGYDNQPAFTLDGSAILYTSMGRDGQADIWYVSLSEGDAVQLTSTRESEYSATPFERGFATVRVERDSTQRVWWFPLNDTIAGSASLLVPDLAPVGYFAFVRQGEIAAFVLGQPPTLQVVRTGSGAGPARLVATDVGRSIQRIPGAEGRVSFVQKTPDGWWITGLRTAQGELGDSTWQIAPTLPEVEDHVWLGPDVILMAQGSVVHRWHVGQDTAWVPAFDLSSSGIVNVSRLALSPDASALALVADDQLVPPVPSILEDAWHDLVVLSADSLMGRATGTPGEKMAAAFLAERFEEAGLQPGGDDGTFLQRVPVAVRHAPPNPSGRRVIVRAAPGFRVPADMPNARLDTASNVIGILPGSDPELSHEVVLVTAHFDHVGIGRAVAGDSIYNGADDDASGTAAMLEVARRLASGPAPRRTVIFAAMTGEEVGLIGTRWYIENPTRPLESIVANLNLEMLARPDTAAGGPGRAWLTGYERSTMAEILEAADVPLVPDPRPEQNFFERSDNIAFARLGIVAHTISSFGLHGDYHRPSDELDKVDPVHLAAVIEAVTQATRALADGPRPEWKPGGRPEPRGPAQGSGSNSGSSRRNR